MAINDVLIVMEMDWLPEIEWKVLLALAHIKNHKTGPCYPSYEEISRIAHTSRNSVALSIPKLKDRGLLSWTPGNQHYPTATHCISSSIVGGPLGIPLTPSSTSRILVRMLLPPCSSIPVVLEPVNLQAPRTDQGNESVEEVESDTVPYSTVRVPAEQTDRPNGEHSPAGNPYQISAEDSRNLGQIFNLVIPDNADKDDEAHTEFSLCHSVTPPAKLANCLVWAFTKSKRRIWSLSNAFTSAFKELDPIPQFRTTAKLGEFLEARFKQSF